MGFRSVYLFYSYPQRLCLFLYLTIHLFVLSIHLCVTKILEALSLSISLRVYPVAGLSITCVVKAVRVFTRQSIGLVMKGGAARVSLSDL